MLIRVLQAVLVVMIACWNVGCGQMVRDIARDFEPQATAIAEAVQDGIEQHATNQQIDSVLLALIGLALWLSYFRPRQL